MKYAVDRIEDNIVVLENIETKEKKKVKKDLLPIIKEGSILIEENNSYKLDKEEELKRRITLRGKLNNLVNR